MVKGPRQLASIVVVTGPANATDPTIQSTNPNPTIFLNTFLNISIPPFDLFEQIIPARFDKKPIVSRNFKFSRNDRFLFFVGVYYLLAGAQSDGGANAKNTIRERGDSFVEIKIITVLGELSC